MSDYENGIRNWSINTFLLHIGDGKPCSIICLESANDDCPKSPIKGISVISQLQINLIRLDLLVGQWMQFVDRLSYGRKCVIFRV